MKLAATHEARSLLIPHLTATDSGCSPEIHRSGARVLRPTGGTTATSSFSLVPSSPGSRLSSKMLVGSLAARLRDCLTCWGLRPRSTEPNSRCRRTSSRKLLKPLSPAACPLRIAVRYETPASGSWRRLWRPEGCKGGILTWR